MPYSLSVPENANFVRVTFTAPFTRDLAIESGVRATEFAGTRNLHCFLYDMRQAPNTESAATNYYFVHTEIPEHGLARNARVAILAAPGDHSHDFTATVMHNAGYIVALFHDENAAIEWLATEPRTHGH
jgi:hypothetical protein